MLKAASLFAAFVLFGLALSFLFLVLIETKCRVPEPSPIELQYSARDDRRLINSELYPAASDYYATTHFRIVKVALSKTEQLEQGDFRRAYWKPTGWWQKFLCEVKVSDVTLAFLTYCLIIVGGFQAFYLYRTVNATRQAADAALASAGALTNAERAHVLIESVKLHGIRAIKKNRSGPLEISYRLRNCGRTLAWTRRVAFCVAISDEFFVPLVPDYRSDTSSNMQYPIRPEGDLPTFAPFPIHGLIEVVGKAALPRNRTTIGYAEATSLLAAELFLFVYGYVEYVDVFEPTRTHTTGFCYQWKLESQEIDDWAVPCGTPAYWKYT